MKKKKIIINELNKKINSLENELKEEKLDKNKLQNNLSDKDEELMKEKGVFLY